MKKKEKELRRKKLRTAAITAVLACMAEEAAMMQAGAGQAAEASRPAAPPSMWGMSGRQDMMHFRSMMQMKAFHGGRVR